MDDGAACAGISRRPLRAPQDPGTPQTERIQLRLHMDEGTPPRGALQQGEQDMAWHRHHEALGWLVSQK